MLYLLLSSSIVALISVDVDMFKDMLDLPTHGFKLYALDISEVATDVLTVRSSSVIPTNSSRRNIKH